MQNQTRRTALKILGTSCAAIALPSKLSASDPTLVKPIRLGVIADLHGGLAVDAESRLDTFLNSMADKNVDALIQMGDFAYPNQRTLNLLVNFEIVKLSIPVDSNSLVSSIRVSYKSLFFSFPAESK